VIDVDDAETMPGTREPLVEAARSLVDRALKRVNDYSGRHLSTNEIQFCLRVWDEFCPSPDFPVMQYVARLKRMTDLDDTLFLHLETLLIRYVLNANLDSAPDRRGLIRSSGDTVVELFPDFDFETGGDEVSDGRPMVPRVTRRYPRWKLRKWRSQLVDTATRYIGPSASLFFTEALPDSLEESLAEVEYLITDENEKRDFFTQMTNIDIENVVLD